MSEHALQSWLDDACNNTQPLYFLLDSALDDTFGWGERFQQMKGFNTPCGLLLTGPDGCGKHTAAAHMLGLLNNSHYALLLNGRELCADGFAIAKLRLRYALDHTFVADNGVARPWCLILEDLEDCSFRQELFTWLGQALSFEWFGETDNPGPLFLILIDAIAEDIPSILRRHLRLCRMSLPSADRRRAYFEKIDFLSDTVNMDLLVHSTDGLTYAQMVDLARNLQCSLVEGIVGFEKMRDETLMDFLAGQYPEQPLGDPLQSLAESARQFVEMHAGMPVNYAPQSMPAAQSLPASSHQSIELRTALSEDHPLHSLVDSARQFVERLPELIAQMGKTGVVVSGPTGNNEDIIDVLDIENSEENRAAYEKKINDMPVKELCADIFGSDGLADLQQYRPHA